MILMLDSIGQRYGCLPSEVLARGDTLDIEVLIRSVAWQNNRERELMSGTKTVDHGLSVDEMQAMLSRVRS